MIRSKKMSETVHFKGQGTILKEEIYTNKEVSLSIENKILIGRAIIL